jgi:hypothetical protein
LVPPQVHFARSFASIARTVPAMAGLRPSSANAPGATSRPPALSAPAQSAGPFCLPRPASSAPSMLLS